MEKSKSSRKLIIIAIVAICLFSIYLFIQKRGDSDNAGLFSASENSVDKIYNWNFDYSEKQSAYILSFYLLDKNKEITDVDTTVKISIENNSGSEVFSDTLSGRSGILGNNVAIPEAQIMRGGTSCGTVKFTVSGKGFRFDTISIDTTILPTASPTISAEGLPINISEGGIIKIESVSFTYNQIKSELTMTVIGEKKSGTNENDIFEYRIYDSDGFFVTSGQIKLNSLIAGDKFTASSEAIDTLDPLRSYTVKFNKVS